MVNDTIEELMDLDMAPKLESLRWKSTCMNGDMRTLRFGGRDKVQDLFLRRLFWDTVSLVFCPG